MKAEFDRIKSLLNEKLLSFKNEKQISKKVYTKYQNIIKDRISSEILAYNLSIYSEIKAQETMLQKKKGFNKIYKFIENLNKNENQLNQYKENETLIEDSFNKLWDEIQNEHYQEQEEMFTDYCDNIFKVIQEEFKKYILSSQERYKQAFMSKLIKQKPKEQEFIEQLEIMQSQLNQIQFVNLEKSQKTYQYSENFALSIPQRVATSQENSILYLGNFYRWKITFQFLQIKHLEEYLKSKFIEDLKNYIKKDPQKQERKAIKEFLNHFIIFQYQITEENLDKLELGYKSIESKSLLDLLTKDNNLDVCNDQIEISLNFFKKNCEKLTKNFQKDDKTFPITSNLDFNAFQAEFLKENKYLLKIIKQMEPDPRQRNKELFSLIDNKCDLQRSLSFKNQIVNFVTTLMKENDGWIKMYGQIHLIILQEITNHNGNIMQSQIADYTNISQYSFSLIKRIMQKIELKIKEYNLNFSNFGVMLNDVGERCVFNFAIFTIWRLLCFGQWQSTQINIEELQSQKQEQFLKFSADILQNKQLQSKISGATHANNIINFAIQRFYVEYAVESSKTFEKYQSKSSYDIIKQLDIDILERKDNNINKDDIFKYISNQTDYLEKHIKKTFSNIKEELINKFIQQLRRDLKHHLEKVEANTKNLYEFTVDSTQAEEYLIGLKNSKEAPNLLFKIVSNCLSGQELGEYSSMIHKDKIDAFSTTDFHQFEFQLTSALQNQEGEIQILLPFVRGFKARIREQITNIDKLKIDIAKLNIQDAIDKMMLKQIGCLEVCPMCKRKCDSDIEDGNHVHQCRNGHQLRGMAGVLIGFHPSLYTCEEIKDDYQIQELEINSTKTWRQIKQIYNTWQFKCLEKEQQKLLKQKYMNIWNNDIGKMICTDLSKKLGKEVFYTPKQEVELSKYKNYFGASHFFLILDDSGSMQGEKFNSAKTGLIAFLHEISNNAQNRVTLIIFNSSARCVVDCQQPNPSQQVQSISYVGGGTDFNQAFLLAYQKIKNNKDYHNFESLSIFFYTDGEAPFPGQAIGEFQKLPTDLKQKLRLIACTEEKDQLQSLEKIVEFFSKECQEGQLNHSMKPVQIGQVWIEQISNKTHQIKKCC